MQIKVTFFEKNINKGDKMHEIDMKKYQIRTDLVVDMLDYDKNIVVEEYNENAIRVNFITLDKDNSLNKSAGKYITIFFDDATDEENKNNLIDVFVSCLKKLIPDIDNKKFLIVGLGNMSSTPDSLGPKVINDILVTRYLFENNNIEVESGFSNVSAFNPGVSGTTGIESSDIIKGIIEKTKPDILIAIDALASSSIDRINKTIQMTDTGIAPGSGVGNKRKELSLNTLGIPVIAIGIPTVIDGVTIVSDTINYMIKKFSYNKSTANKQSEKLAFNRNYLKHKDTLTSEEKEKILGLIGTLNEEEIKKLIFEVLSPINYNLMVTVKEIDFLIDKLSKVISTGINQTLHPNYKK